MEVRDLGIHTYIYCYYLWNFVEFYGVSFYKH